MLKTVETFIREQDLIPPGSTVLCAVSGGADSIAMLHILYRLRDSLDFSLAAAHYNHKLRGAESDMCSDRVSDIFLDLLLLLM